MNFFFQEQGLYYDGHNGIYYSFNESSKSFQFHSQVPLPSAVPPTDQGEDPVTAAVRRKSDALDIVEEVCHYILTNKYYTIYL